MSAGASKEYYGITVVIGTTALNLLALLRAVEADVQATCRELRITSSRSNTTNEIVSVGDENVLSTAAGRKGYSLLVTEFRDYRAEINSIQLGRIFIISDTVTTEVNVEIMRH